MEQEAEKAKRKAIYRRMAYMAVAIVAAALLPLKPAFKFQEDKGIYYVRSFEMNQRTLYVTQTRITTGVPTVVATMSVKWLYYCNKAMIWGCVLCFLCFFSHRGRIAICDIVSILAGAYYLLMIYYAMKISDLHFATLTPGILSVVLPAIVMQMMILTRRSVVKTYQEEADEILNQAPD